MNETLRKNAWIVRLAGLAVVVGFAGSAAATYVGSRRAMRDDATGVHAEDDEDDEDDASDESGEAGAPVDEATARARSKSRGAERLGERNVFCPGCRPVETPIVETSSGEAPPGGAAVKSTLPLALIATMEADDPLDSMATIQHTDTGSAASYMVQERIRDGVTVVEIGRGRVVLLNGQRREFIVMGDAPPPSVVASAESEPSEPRPSNEREIEGANEAISCEGDTCTIDRAFVDKVLGNPAMLAKQARVVPSVKDGETRGFKFYGVRPGSLPKLLGINNGDMVTSVNGQALTSVDQAMGLYAKMRGASKLEVEIDRRGQPVTKQINIK